MPSAGDALSNEQQLAPFQPMQTGRHPVRVLRDDDSGDEVAAVHDDIYHWKNIPSPPRDATIGEDDTAIDAQKLHPFQELMNRYGVATLDDSSDDERDGPTALERLAHLKRRVEDTVEVRWRCDASDRHRAEKAYQEAMRALVAHEAYMYDDAYP